MTSLELPPGSREFYEQKKSSGITREKKKSNVASNFSQQKLRAWQPVLTPRWVISVFLGFGVLFVTLGTILLTTSNRVVECSVAYGDPETACSDITSCTTLLEVTIKPENCMGSVKPQINGPIFVYYELSHFYQNHRRYVKSRNNEQLKGKVFTNSDDLSSCAPVITDPDGRVYHPCGLIAWSVFNDSYAFTDNDGTPIIVDDSATTIAWSTDVQRKFKNPTSPVDTTKVNEWLNEEIFPGKVENGHFMVWMRNAALPTFRKLWGKIAGPIKLPITVQISSRFPVASFKGTKKLVISTTSWLGGRNSFLGVAYLVIGTWCLVFGIFFVSKNYRSPRILGDVRYLNWVGKKQ